MMMGEPENKELPSLDISESEGEEKQFNDDAALDEVILAATGRDFSARRARKQATDVEQGVGEEDAFAASVSKTRSGSEVLGKMLSVLQGDGEGEDATKNLGALKKRVAQVENSGKKPLAAPLPDVVAGRLERIAAYKQSNQEVTEKWSRVVQENRQVRTLQLPLGRPTKPEYTSTGDAVKTFQPGNDFEREIDALLKEGGVTGEDDVMKKEKEDLTAAKISKEEVIARRRELAKMRSLAFEYERKMKRIKKIKSKKFRKIMEHEKMKLKEELGGDELEDVTAERMESERKRAEERMSLRHKNTSKWVKRQLQRGVQNKNPDARAAIEEQLRTHEALKKRQEGVIELDGSDQDSDLEGIGNNVEELDGALDEMKKDLEAPAVVDKKKKGIAGMKFMQIAAERERQRALELLKEMGSDEEGLGEYGSDVENGKPVGRMKFSGPQDDEKREKEVEHDAEEDKRIRKQYEDDAKGEGGGAQIDASSVELLVREVNDASNGFVTKLDGKISADVPFEDDATQVVIGQSEVEERGTVLQSTGRKESLEKTQETVQQTKATKKNRRNRTEPVAENAEAKVERAKKKVRFSPTDQVKTAKHNELRTPVIESNGEVSKQAKMTAAQKTFEDDRARMEMVARAFAGLGGADEADFEAAKQEEIEKDIDAETKAAGTQVLPGWGAWDGAGVKKKKKKSAFAEAAERKLEEARARAIAARADKNKAYLQLSGKRSNGARALTISNAPFPFRNAKEWAKELDTPRVKELTAGRVFRRNIKEKVETMKGVPILPIEFDGNRMEKKEVKAGRVTKENRRGKRGVLERRQKASKARERKRRGFMA